MVISYPCLAVPYLLLTSISGFSFMRNLLIIIAFVLAFAGCKERYDPEIESPHTGYLVVEGFINSSNEKTIIHLSRTLKLVDSVFYKPERRAHMVVEGDNNDRFILQESAAGVYISAQPLPLNISAKYRLKISTQGNEYASEYSPVNRTSPIDSISWKREFNGVQLYVHTHDDKTNEKSYYRWQFNETWEIRSSNMSNLQVIYDKDKKPLKVDYKYPDQSYNDSIFYCWQYFNSSNLILGSTERLEKNVMQHPITSIPPRSIKLGVLYSIEIKQYGMSKKAYDFYLQMKKNTEQLGSIFDAQPSELNSNITNLNDPSEIVIGFVEVNDMQAKRLFIARSQVADWGYGMFCQEVAVPNHPDSIQAYSMNMPTIPAETSPTGAITSYFSAPAECVDCRLRGSNIKPPFWP